jgi:hypothetical protein
MVSLFLHSFSSVVVVDIVHVRAVVVFGDSLKIKVTLLLTSFSRVNDYGIRI